MLSPFLVSLPKSPISFPLPHSTTHPLPLPGLGIPLYWGIESSQDQGPLLPLMVLSAKSCCSSYRAADPFSSLGTFSSSFIGDPVLRPIDDCEHLLLYLPGTGIASYETAISFSKILLAYAIVSAFGG